MQAGDSKRLLKAKTNAIFPHQSAQGVYDTHPPTFLFSPPSLLSFLFHLFTGTFEERKGKQRADRAVEFTTSQAPISPSHRFL